MKTKKSIKKFIFILPFGILLGLIILLTLVKPFTIYWPFGILIGLIITTYSILVNINDYNAIDNLPLRDFLESKHQYTFKYDPYIWSEFDSLIEKQFTDYKVYKNTPEEIVVKVENSTIRMKQNNDELLLTVERNAFDFIPDRGRNYRMLMRIIKALKG